MKKLVVAMLLVANIIWGNISYSQTKGKNKNKQIAGCPTNKPRRHIVKHHHVQRKPVMVMKEETITVENHLPISTVEINRGNVYVNDSLVAVVVNPKYENYHIIMNNVLPQMNLTDNVAKENSFTGNKPEHPRLGVYTCSYCHDGALIEGLVPCGPAEKAGLRRGDIITKINDNTIKNKSELLDALGNYNEGDKISITYMHFGNLETTDATLVSTDKEENCKCYDECYSCKGDYARSCCRW